MKKYIAVFCSAENLPEIYTHPAKEFARLIAQHGYGLVWRGSDSGLTPMPNQSRTMFDA